ncbi:hypothetical protein ACIBI8_33665 [Streptomyces sp. NPDC050529]|uniref:hypothetical protein n=1 Tax=unclassified Streptomyces TaxID=2593676 RepID=UPI0037BB22BB
MTVVDTDRIEMADTSDERTLDMMFEWLEPTVPGDWAGVSLLSRTPRTVLGALVSGVLDPEAATRILSVVRSREAGFLATWPNGYGQRRRGGPDPSRWWIGGPAR